MSIENGTDDVDPELKEIKFVFDRTMDRRRRPLVSQGEGGATPYSGTARPVFDEHGLVLTVPVELQPGREYRFTLGFPNGGFIDTHGVEMKPVEVRFSTAPAGVLPNH